MKILLCDDNNDDLKKLQRMISEYMDSVVNIPYEIIVYNVSQQLDFELEDLERADLYILDIDMPNVNGITIATKLKKIYPNLLLYFYTSHAEYATIGYRYDAKRYILKQRTEDELTEALDYACEVYRISKKSCISISTSHGFINIPFDEVKYVEKEDRRSVIYTRDNEKVSDKRGIRELYKSFPQENFLFIDKGRFINVDYVYQTEQDKVILFDKNVFEISRRRINILREALLKHWRGL